MAKVSIDTTEVTKDMGVALDRCSTLDGYTINFVSIREDADLGPMLASLPGGHCSCPHWGYLFAGRMTVRYGDHEETIEAGEAFYLPPGHVPKAAAGTEFVQFSPAEELAATEAAIAAAMA
jgi:mannose-6-phosphate isomerase-like protein (cupin superfamily)